MRTSYFLEKCIRKRQSLRTFPVMSLSTGLIPSTLHQVQANPWAEPVFPTPASLILPSLNILHPDLALKILRIPKGLCRNPILSFVFPPSELPTACALATWETLSLCFLYNVPLPAQSGADEWLNDAGEAKTCYCCFFTLLKKVFKNIIIVQFSKVSFIKLSQPGGIKTKMQKGENSEFLDLKARRNCLHTPPCLWEYSIRFSRTFSKKVRFLQSLICPPKYIQA